MIGNAGVYSAQFSLIPGLIYCGIGNWNGNWTVGVNTLGKQILVGSGEFFSKGYLSTIVLKAKLQIDNQPDRVLPFPEPKPEISIWEGNISIVGGNLQGLLQRVSGNQYPNIYNIIGNYNQIIENGTIIIKVNDITIKY